MSSIQTDDKAASTQFEECLAEVELDRNFRSEPVPVSRPNRSPGEVWKLNDIELQVNLSRCHMNYADHEYELFETFRPSHHQDISSVKRGRRVRG